MRVLHLCQTSDCKPQASTIRCPPLHSLIDGRQLCYHVKKINIFTVCQPIPFWKQSHGSNGGILQRLLRLVWPTLRHLPTGLVLFAARLHYDRLLQQGHKRALDV